LPNFGYSYPVRVDEREAIASVRDVRVSFKEMVELVRELRGMKLEDAFSYLDEVIAMKRPVPFRRHKGGVGHRRGLEGWKPGRYPVKAAKIVKSLLESVKANAENKGLDTSRLYIKHIAAQKGMKLRRIFPRAYGRATPRIEQLVHVEVVVGER